MQTIEDHIRTFSITPDEWFLAGQIADSLREQHDRLPAVKLRSVEYCRRIRHPPIPCISIAEPVSNATVAGVEARPIVPAFVRHPDLGFVFSCFHPTNHYEIATCLFKTDEDPHVNHDHDQPKRFALFRLAV